MSNFANSTSPLPSDDCTTIHCAVPGCHRWFRTSKLVSATTSYVCLVHSPFTASKCWATDLTR